MSKWSWDRRVMKTASHCHFFHTYSMLSLLQISFQITCVSVDIYYLILGTHVKSRIVCFLSSLHRRIHSETRSHCSYFLFRLFFFQKTNVNIVDCLRLFTSKEDLDGNERPVSAILIVLVKANTQDSFSHSLLQLLSFVTVFLSIFTHFL